MRIMDANSQTLTNRYAGDESYHSECFRCRMCQRKIEDLVFAKTSQGIYCIACHNGRMAKNRKNKTRSSKDLKDKTLPSVPATELAESTQIKSDMVNVRHSVQSRNQQLTNQRATPQTDEKPSLKSNGDSALPSPNRRPPPTPTVSSHKSSRPKTGTFQDFDFDLVEGAGTQGAVPIILQDERPLDFVTADPFTAQDQSSHSSTAPEASRAADPHKSSVRERRRPTDNELRLHSASMASDDNLLSPSNRDEVPSSRHSGGFSLFPPRSAEVPRTPNSLAVPSPAIDKQHTITQSRNGSPNSTPPIASSPISRRSPLAEPRAPEALPRRTVSAEDKSVLHADDLRASPAHIQSTTEVESIYSGKDVIDNVPSSPPASKQDIRSPLPPRRADSRSSDHYPLYKSNLDSPVTMFENDLSKAFNLSPQAKRNSQQSLGGNLERHGTISRLAGRMLKHKKSVSGSAISSKSNLHDRQHSITDLADVSSLQAELKIKSERIAYLEQSLAKVVDVQAVERDLEARKSLLAKVENQLVQAGAEHQSYLHHRHRISDVNTPLVEWKSKVLADLDATLQKTRDSLSGEIEVLLRERSDLKRENDRLEAKRAELTEDVSVLSNRQLNLIEMHDSMLKQIQIKMEENKDRRLMSPSRAEETQARSPMRSPSFNSFDAEVRSNSMVDQESETALAPNTVLSHHALIEEEEEPIVESAVKRMSGERVAEMAAPKKFNLVKKTKKAFRWGRGTPNSDGPVSQYSTTSPSTLSLAERTMSSSRSSDKLSTKPSANNMFKRTWQSQQNLSSYLEPRSDDTSVLCTTLFGNDLTKQALSENRLVPHIVTSCIKVIENRALEFEGLYRKSGGAGEMKSLIEAFEIANSEGDTINIPGFLDISAITSVLKQYLRKLPVPLVTFDNYEPFIGTSAIPNTTIRIRAVKEVLCDLPECHQETLRAVLRHLQLVSRHAAKNLMTTKNLAVVLGPSIIWDHAGEKEIIDMHDKNSCIQFCIEHAEEL